MGFLSSIGDAIGSVFGGGDILGTAISAAGSFIGQTTANSANRDIANQQMAFQQMNSDTAYRRAVADMQAAGLNPMLAYSQGGASTPSGASAVMQDAITPAISSANQSRNTSAAVQNMAAQTEKTKVDTVNSATQAELNRALETKAHADAILSASSAAQAAASTDKIRQDTSGAKSEADWNASHPRTVGIGRYIDTLTGGLRAGHSAKSLVTKGN